MNLLLDTCTFLWIVSGDPALSEVARSAFSSAENSCFLSAVSVWEISVKHVLGRLPLPTPPSTLIPKLREAHDIAPLPLDEEAIFHLPKLPAVHRDPFDRMLICQAIAHGMVLLTPDSEIGRYPVRTLW